MRETPNLGRELSLPFRLLTLPLCLVNVHVQRKPYYILKILRTSIYKLHFKRTHHFVTIDCNAIFLKNILFIIFNVSYLTIIIILY